MKNSIRVLVAAGIASVCVTVAIAQTNRGLGKDGKSKSLTGIN